MRINNFKMRLQMRDLISEKTTGLARLREPKQM